MKKVILTIAVLLGLGFNAKADTSIDDQINNAQDFVVVGTPTYQGYRFVAVAAQKDYAWLYNPRARAEGVCKIMGLGIPTAYSVTFIVQGKSKDSTTRMWSADSDTGNLELFDYDNSYLGNRSAYITNLACKKK